MPPKPGSAGGKGPGQGTAPAGASIIDSVFPVWDTQAVVQELASSQGPYVDPDGLVLPSALQNYLDTWKRPGELLANIADVKIVDLAPGPNGQGFSRSQKASTSVYAGHVIFEWLLTIYLLLLGTEVQEGDLLWELIWPKGPDGQPCQSPSGKYCIRMYIVDGWRKVTIDDRIPVDMFGRPLLVTARPTALWPFLINKAVLKLLNAYKVLDKPSTDDYPVIHWLTGWARENLGSDPRGGAIFDRVQSALGTKALSTIVLRNRMTPARRQPQLLILCSPPGLPKKEFVNPLIERYPQALGAVVSSTNRLPYEHEENGVDFHFMTQEEMEAELDAGAFLEATEAKGFHYGTTVSAVRTVAATGRLCVLVIDIEGVAALRQREEVAALYLYMAPRSEEAHRQRLRSRLREDESTVQKRLRDAAAQYEEARRVAQAQAAANAPPGAALTPPGTAGSVRPGSQAKDRGSTPSSTTAGAAAPAAPAEPPGPLLPLDHVLMIDEFEALYYQLKNACAELSPVIRNRLRGLPAYVLDYSDVIPSNSVEKPTLKPVVLAGPSASEMERLVVRITEEFPDVFGFPVETTTREQAALRPRVPPVDSACVGEEEFAALLEAGSFVAWNEDAYVHASLKKRTGITRQAVADVISTGRLCLIVGTNAAAEQVKAAIPDSMTIFLGPTSMILYEERLRQELMRPEEQIEEWMAAHAANRARIEDDPDLFDHIVEDEATDGTAEEVVRLVSEYRPDVIAPKNEDKSLNFKPLVLTSPQGVGRALLLAMLQQLLPDALVRAKTVTTRAVADEEKERFVQMQRADFEAAVALGRILKPWEDAGELYGTSVEELQFLRASKKLAVFDGDVRQAAHIKDAVPTAFLALVAPESVEAFAEKLRKQAEAAAAAAGAAPPDPAALEAQVAERTQQLTEELDLVAELADMTLDDTDLQLVVRDLHQALADANPGVVPQPSTPLVLSGAPGSATKELVEMLAQEFPGEFQFTVTTTSRPPRADEKDGREFWFVSEEEFRAGVEAGKFLEWAAVDIEAPPPENRITHLYGTTVAAFRAAASGGRTPILEADVESARSLRASGFRAAYVFASAPSPAAGAEALALFRQRMESVLDAHERIDEYLHDALDQRAHAEASGAFDLVLSGDEDLSASYCRLKEALAVRGHLAVPMSSVWGYGRALWDSSVRVHGEAPLRIMLLGPAASGKSTQAVFICERYRLPYINVGQLLREAVYDNPTDVGMRCQKFINASKPLPDDLMLELLRERLMREDCRRTGWLIDGFAHTHKQAEALAAYGIVPDKVIIMCGSYSTMMARARTRKLDPVTQRVYNPECGIPAPDEETARRLQKRHDDMEENVRKRLNAYEAQEPRLKALFGDVSIYVDVEHSPEEVARAIDAFVSAEAGAFKNIRPANLRELRVLEYQIVGVSKLNRRSLLLLRDLISPVRGPDVWVDLAEICRHTRAVLVYSDPAVFSTTHRVERMATGGAAPELPLVLVDSPEPVEILTTLTVGPVVHGAGAGLAFPEAPHASDSSLSVASTATARGRAAAGGKKAGGSPSAHPGAPSRANSNVSTASAALGGAAQAYYHAHPDAVPNVRECHALLDEYDWRSPTAGNVLVHLATATAEARMVVVPRGRHVLRISVDSDFVNCCILRSSTPFRLEKAPVLLAEAEGVAVCEAPGTTLDVKPGDWSVLLRQSFSVQAPPEDTQDAVLMASMQSANGGTLSDAASRVMLTLAVADPAVAASLRFCVVNNDTSEVATHLVGKLPTTAFAHNTYGYTVLVYQLGTVPLPPAAFKLTAFSSQPLLNWAPVAPAKTGDLSEEYAPNKLAILCHYIITVPERSQMALRFETDVSSAFTMTLSPIDGAAGEQEQIWNASVIHTLPAITLTAPKYRLEMRLDRDACPFVVAADGDIPGTLKWRLRYSTTRPVELNKDTARQQELAETVAHWNLKGSAQDPANPAPPPAAAAKGGKKGEKPEEFPRAAMSRAAAERHAAGQKVLERTKDAVSVKLRPEAVTVVRKAGEGAAQQVLQPDHYDERHQQMEAKVSEAQTAIAASAESRTLSHGEREAQRAAKENKFADFREKAVLSAREQYLAARAQKASYASLAKPATPPADGGGAQQ